MPKVSKSEIRSYGSTGNSYFTLKNHKDKVQVRVLAESTEDFECYSYHSIEIGDRTFSVNCLRTNKDPVDMCPLCASGSRPQARIFIPLLMEDGTDTVSVWDRGLKMLDKFESLEERYSPLHDHVFEIERNGEAGSKQTSYEIYHLAEDPCALDELPEALTIEGNFVKERDFDQLVEWLDDGVWYNDDGEVDDDYSVRKPKARTRGTQPAARGTAAQPVARGTGRGTAPQGRTTAKEQPAPRFGRNKPQETPPEESDDLPSDGGEQEQPAAPVKDTGAKTGRFGNKAANESAKPQGGRFSRGGGKF